MEAKENTTRYVTETAKRVCAVLDGCGFKYPSDLSAARIASWLADQRTKGMGAATSNHYLTAVKGFCAWLVRERRMTANPLAHLSRLNAETDVRRERRTLAADVFAELVEAAVNGPIQHGLSGGERAMLYRTAAFTGLRASELASLTARSFDLESQPATVTVEAAYSKRRRDRTFCRCIRTLLQGYETGFGNVRASSKGKQSCWRSTMHLTRISRVCGPVRGLRSDTRPQCCGRI